MRSLIILLFAIGLTACTTRYPAQSVKGKVFPSVTGQTLEKNTVSIPQDFNDDATLLLVGYVQDTQFDIDRWLIGLDMTKTQVATYEIPTIQGMFPRMFSTFIDNGMRSGIPKPLWKGVITVYQDGDKVQAFTGNDMPRNARVLLLNTAGEILYFYDDGFSVQALNELREVLANNR
ncbi:hypothetical protein [Veronia pacifica]|uniref:Lipoprotein n=1 Tax=Veronia pacifica TaxID=1080227 RepID=A0A1C3EJX7_9GAMM|nr:hypothetical protein [Veronia pacifica]ODA33536.1 hypothetical protein A8L45_10020 [Veronia pacifica]